LKKKYCGLNLEVRRDGGKWKWGKNVERVKKEFSNGQSDKNSFNGWEKGKKKKEGRKMGKKRGKGDLGTRLLLWGEKKGNHI